jgi:hypothetical protein
MYLIDTSVISEARKGDAANPGVRAFFQIGLCQEHVSGHMIVPPCEARPRRARAPVIYRISPFLDGRRK